MPVAKRNPRARFLAEIERRFEQATIKLRRLAELGDEKKYEMSDEEAEMVVKRLDAEVVRVRSYFGPRISQLGFK